MGFYVGVDVGGTFTDGVVVDDAGRVRVVKTPSVPGDPSRGFLDCLRRAGAAHGLALPDFLARVEKLAYGTTLAANLIVEGKGARAGLITTRGFKDTLPIARIGREYLGIDLQVERPPALIPRWMIAEVTERVDSQGAVVTPLQLAEVGPALDDLASHGLGALAIALLWSFRNAAHEEAVAGEVARLRPDLYLSLSSQVAPISGEYERTATAVMNALLGPPLRGHLEGLAQRLAGEGFRGALLLMQSTGGATPVEDAALTPVTLINSGPAGGLLATAFFGRMLGLKNLIAVDMGGTTFDASLITEGQVPTRAQSRVAGHNIYVPMLEIQSIGAGGGSIAWIDAGSRLKVGPRSAGADPGPACYPAGGDEPTVTDADLLLGRLNPGNFVGGELLLSVERARAAMEERIARPLGMTALEAARGIATIVDANMADALRRITLQKGHDPRDFTLVAFGGAGPTHAAALARDLGIRRIIVAPMATAQSAFGVVAADIAHSFWVSDVFDFADAARVNAHLAALEARGHALLEREGIPAERRRMVRWAEVRYRGQAHQVMVPVPAGDLDGSAVEQVRAAFEERYEALYGRDSGYREAGVELVNLRVDAVGLTRQPAITPEPVGPSDPSSARRDRRFVYLGGPDLEEAEVYVGESLRSGHVLSGPAVVEYVATTVLINAGQRASVDPYLNLIIEEEV